MRNVGVAHREKGICLEPNVAARPIHANRQAE